MRKNGIALRIIQHRPFQPSDRSFRRSAAPNRRHSDRGRELAAGVAPLSVVLGQAARRTACASRASLTSRWAMRSAGGRAIIAVPRRSSGLRRDGGDARFRAGVDRVIAASRLNRVCMMCSEREPLDCHRCLLIAPALAQRGLNVGHILADGTVEPHAETEERLLALCRQDARPVRRRPRATSRRGLSPPRRVCRIPGKRLRQASRTRPGVR